METTKIISPYFENGIFAGVRVCVGDEDFVIAPTFSRRNEFINIKDEDWKYFSDGKRIYFTSKRDENEIIGKWYSDNLSKLSIDFNENAPLPETE